MHDPATKSIQNSSFVRCVGSPAFKTFVMALNWLGPTMFSGVFARTSRNKSRYNINNTDTETTDKVLPQ